MLCCERGRLIRIDADRAHASCVRFADILPASYFQTRLKTPPRHRVTKKTRLFQYRLNILCDLRGFVVDDLAKLRTNSTRSLKLETRNCILPMRGAVAQFGRAPRSQCGGQGFDPPLLHHKAHRTKDLARHITTDEFPEMTNTWPIFSGFKASLMLPTTQQ